MPRLKKLGVGGVITLNEPYETLVPSSLYYVSCVSSLFAVRIYIFLLLGSHIYIYIFLLLGARKIALFTELKLDAIDRFNWKELSFLVSSSQRASKEGLISIFLFTIKLVPFL